MRPEEARELLERSRELRFAFPSSFGNPGLEGEPPEREELVEAVHVLDDEQADALAANAGRVWRVEPREIEGGRTCPPGRASALALYGAGLFALRAGDVAESRKLNEQALDLAGAPAATALAHLGLTRVALEERDADRALQHAVKAREAAEPLGEPMAQAPLGMHAQALRLAGDLDGAAELFEQSLARNRRIGDEGMVVVELYNLGLLSVRRGDAVAAERYLSQFGDDALAQAALAYVQGDRDRARMFLDQVGEDLPSDDRAEAEWLRSRV